MNFKPGDRALIGNGNIKTKALRVYVGTHCTLLTFVGDRDDNKDVWRIKAHDGIELYAAQRILHKPDDGYDKASWEDSVWRPSIHAH